MLSLLLFIHLFAVTMALLCNGAGEFPPRLPNDIRLLLFRPYLYLTWLDVGYQHHYVGRDEVDFQHSLEAEVTMAGGNTEKVRIEPDAASGLRRDRYEQLSHWLAYYVGDPNRESLLPAAVGGGVLKQLDARAADVTLRCTRHVPQSLDSFRASGAQPRQKQLVYQGKIRLVGSQGRVIERTDSRGQVGVTAGGSASVPPQQQLNPPATALPR